MERERPGWNWLADRPEELAGRYWRHLGGGVGLALRLALLGLALLAIELHIPDGESLLALGLAALTVVLAATAALPLAVYATIWAAFVVLRAWADDSGLPDRGGRVASLDRWLGNGVMPGARLQGWLHDSAVGGAIDAAAAAVHLSYFVVPHLVAVGFWWLAFTGRSDRFFRFYVTALGLVMAVGLLGYTLLPTAPPWLEATRSGESIGIERIAGGGATDTRNADDIYAIRDPNPVAALPSLHLAITLAIAGALWWYDRRLGLLGILYTLLMGFSLVYLGEHYLVDVLAGAVLAVVVVVCVALYLDASPRSAMEPERKPHAGVSGAALQRHRPVRRRARRLR